MYKFSAGNEASALIGVVLFSLGTFVINIAPTTCNLFLNPMWIEKYHDNCLQTKTHLQTRTKHSIN